MGHQKNHLNEMVLLSTHIICFHGVIKIIAFDFTLLSGTGVESDMSQIIKVWFLLEFMLYMAVNNFSVMLGAFSLNQ